MKTADAMTWEEAVLWLREQPDQVELVRACFYDDPLLAAAERYYQSSEWLAVRELLPRPPGKALDLGAGRGISSYALARDGWDTTALEPDPSAIVGTGAIRNLSRESGLRIEIAEDRAEKLPFDDGSFDLVHGRQILHHSDHLERLCGEVARVLKPGGVFIATREHVISRQGDLQRFLDSHPLHRFYGGENAFQLDEYRNALMRGGLDVIRILNPFQSDINLFPETLSDLKTRLAGRIHFPFPGIIPDWSLALIGALSRQPGRLYTFLARKSHAG